MSWRDRIVSLERIPASQLMSHTGNWRLHPANQEAALAGLLDDVGQAAALLVYHSERQGGLTIIDGHLRSRMAQDATWPCLMLDVTDSEADMLLATLDPLAAMAERDERQLATLLAGLRSDDQAVTALLGTLGGDPASRTPPGAGVRPARTQAQGEELARLRLRLQTAPGQLWACGVHRVYCGDACEPASYAAVCAGTEVHAVVGDPPYGVGVEYEGFVDTPEAVRGLIPGCMPHLLGYPVVALTTGLVMMWEYPRPAWMWVWVHPASMVPGPWGWNGVNPILVWGHDPYLKAGLGKRQDHVVLAANREGDGTHPATKPLKVWSWLIERVTTEPGQTILDPFLGSGTTIIAAEQTGRRALGIEKDPGYVAVALDRWERSTGRSPTLLSPS